VIDLHTHTTASDGRSSPLELVALASRAGVRALSVTDHDTVAACDDVATASAAAGIAFVPGIEMTAVVDGADVHVLGYFLDVRSPSLLAFLASQRIRRIDRVRQMIARLADHGLALDADLVVRPALDDATRAAGRPWIARALVAAGYVTSTTEAFDRWLGRGCPGFIPRWGAGPDEVIERIHEAGGLASLAHPGLLNRDEDLHGFVQSGLDAIEAYHPDHDENAVARYLAMARVEALLVTGGSDFHGDGAHGATGPGSVSLPAADFARLRDAHEDRWRV
jgi:predicted metal-dependent phosphoesterase TrpH